MSTMTSQPQGQQLSHSQGNRPPAVKPAKPPLPLLQHLVRTVDGVYTVFDHPKFWKRQWEEKVSKRYRVPASGIDVKVTYAKNGKLYAVPEPGRVTIYDSKSLKIIQTIRYNDVEIMEFSPQNSFLVTFKRIVGRSSQSGDRSNMIIWDLSTGNPVRRFYQKEYNLERRPLVWTDNEEILVHLVTNRVNVYDGLLKQTESLHAINVKGVTQFSLSPGTPKDCHIAIFVPELKGSPARINVYKYPDLEKPSASKQFYKAQEVTIKWNYCGSTLLAQTSTDVSNNSYYGEIGLHLMQSDGSNNMTVTFGMNKGPVQSTAWSPTRNQFIVIQGFQPAKITLYNGNTCSPVQSYGTASRNHIIWSPHGRFVCFGAFDNLGTGEMDFWDNHKFKLIGQCKDMDAPSMWEWTPDSRNLITAVLYPRRRTDNGYKAWSYCGELLYHQKIQKIYQVAIRHNPPGTYPDRPMSPRLAGRKLQKPQNKVTAPKAYIPPHLRNRGAGPSTIMKTATLGAHKYQMSPKEIAARNKLKNQKRRERRKLAKQREEEQRIEEEKRIEAEKKVAEEKKAQDDLRKRVETLLAGEPEVKDKALRKLRQKLSQIKKLKDRIEAGETLDQNQVAKMNNEKSVEWMIEQLKIPKK